MDNLRRLGGLAGIVSGLATAWLTIGLTVAFPAAGITLRGQNDPNKYLPFIAKHTVLFWTTDVLGGVLAALAAAILMLALADRFRAESDGQAKIGLAMGLVGALGLAIGAFIRLTSAAYLTAIYGAAKLTAGVAFYAVNSMAHAFLALGAVALGLSALIYGAMMLKNDSYTHAGYVSVVAGTPLIISAFIAGDVLYLIASGLITIWFFWTGALLWLETVSIEPVRGARNGRITQFKVVGRRRERRAV
ncbi:MAG TPA: hypothetical protein VKW09_12230 [bacterium]|nr:hypothetical protein [bacterium]